MERDCYARQANRGLGSPLFVPLRVFGLIGYVTLMRPKNNKALTWEEITVDPVSRLTLRLAVKSRNWPRRKRGTARTAVEHNTRGSSGCGSAPLRK